MKNCILKISILIFILTSISFFEVAIAQTTSQGYDKDLNQLIHPGETYSATFDSFSAYQCSVKSKEPYYVSYAGQLVSSKLPEGNYDITFKPHQSGVLVSSETESPNNLFEGDVAYYTTLSLGIIVSADFTNRLATDTTVNCYARGDLMDQVKITWQKKGDSAYFKNMRQIPSGGSTEFFASDNRPTDFYLRCKHFYTTADEKFNLSYQSQLALLNTSDYSPEYLPAKNGSITDESQPKYEPISLIMHHLRKGTASTINKIGIKFTNNSSDTINIGCDSNADNSHWGTE